MKQKQIKYIDLFAGAGGLSEGFIRAGFKPVAHVESDRAACYTLKTRAAYHWLKSKTRIEAYADYLEGKINRETLYKLVPGKNSNSVINAEIGEEKLPEIFQRIDELIENDKINLIIGGPPCQAYSIVGRSRDKNRMKEDKRNHLYIYYAEFLKRYNPEYFVFENVKGLLSARGKDNDLYFDLMRNLFRVAGYETEFMTLSAEDYGVPQKRKRVIMVGKRGKGTGFYPEPEKWNPGIMVKEVLSDLPTLKSGQGNIGPCKGKSYRGTWLYEAGIKNDILPITWHIARPNTKQDLEIYKIAVEIWNNRNTRLNYNSLPERLKTHQHRVSFSDRFKVVAADLPYSHTVVAHIAKDGHYYIHPDIEQNRSITPREAARLQTFPDDYYFESATNIPRRTPAFHQIGNAVPVLLGEKIANKLMEGW